MGGRAPIVCKAQTKDRVQMLRCRLAVLVGWFLFCRCLLQPHGLNRSRPLAILIAMATARSGNRSNRSKFASIFTAPNDERGYDNAHYIGHDEPGIGFDSTAPRSGNNVQWEFTLPRERLLLATQSFENLIAFWVSMALCDPQSYPKGACIPDSDQNTPSSAGSALLELQFFPPGFPPYISQISRDLTYSCGALTIDSLEVMSKGQVHPNCAEPVNFAFIQKNGMPAGPPGPASATAATLTLNAQTLLMNQGDRIRVTIEDTSDGSLDEDRRPDHGSNRVHGRQLGKRVPEHRSRQLCAVELWLPS